VSQIEPCHNCDTVSTPRAAYVPAADARRRILQAARRLLADRPFSALTVNAVMAEAQLARTVFYRYFDDLPSLAPDLLPDSDAPLIDQLDGDHQEPEQVIGAMLDGLVAIFAQHGPLLRAIDDAARHDAAVAGRLDAALVAPRALLVSLLEQAPHPPPDPQEAARMMMAAHREYLLDRFGAGGDTPAARRAARAALGALWARLLAE
jgi:AcrR family transcriptional regulator